MDNPTIRLLLPLAVAALLYGCASAPSEIPAAAAVETEPKAEPKAEPEPAVRAKKPEPIALKPDYPELYVVKKGDTLWDISGRFLRDPWHWPELWQHNPDIENPHLIYPGDVLRLVYVDGRPTLEVQRADPRLPTERLSPRIRSEELDRAIATIPLDNIRPFLQRPQILDEEELEAAPYIVAAADEHLIAATGNRVYVRGLSEPDLTTYVVVRKGQAYRNADDNELLGYEAIHVADAKIEQFGDPATLMLSKSRREALKGDRLLPGARERLSANFVPRAPQDQVDGQILAVIDGVSQIGQYQVVAINLGEREGMEAGHVLSIYQQGASVSDPVVGGRVTLPEQYAGVMMVFRPFQKMSYALVMEATRPIHVLDRVTNP
ncbi:LysM peptidoglycan-binding domain-containing protein [Thiohalomonas denitrificans]|uniref:LysM domain-containing protein n=1 Tax=Thiohalomonas denitrificans TaxID=415747 RepID=A0A1G5QS61_9GAMM|nr:LysM domain-containing protein [Thiohalomonas denitrificans]SCZ64506.1 LysM domain-containing protein [Thiohalomonas denitrificans]